MIRTMLEQVKVNVGWRFMTGINEPPAPGDRYDTMEIVTLAEALERHWKYDAHMALYYDGTEPGSPLPRINRGIERTAPELFGDLMLPMFVFDFDNPGHAPHVDPSNPRRLPRLEAGPDPNVVYPTKNGWRMIWLLDEPIPAPKFAAAYMVVYNYANETLREIGTLDKLKTWNTLYRLPFIMRQDDPSEEPYLSHAPWVDYPNDQPLASKSVMPAHEMKLDVPPPHAIKAASSEVAGRITDVLAGLDISARLASGSKVERGYRNQWLASEVGKAVARCSIIPGIEEEHLIDWLMERIVQIIEVDASERAEFERAAAGMVTRFWQQDRAALDRGADLLADAMRSASPSMELKSDGELARQKLVVDSGNKECWVMMPNGMFTPHSVSPGLLRTQIQTMGMADRIDLSYIDDKGNKKQLSPNQIIERSATVCHSIKLVPGRIDMPGGWLESVGLGGHRLVLPMFRLNPRLHGEFNQDVDNWLKAFAGEHYEWLNRWLAWSLAIEQGGVCALNIVAPPGVGKKLFTEGLVGCLEDPSSASSADLTDRFSEGLTKSPFILVNEGWTNLSASTDVTALFRSLVTGDRISVEEKYKAKRQIQAHYRVIFTSNNMRVIEQLVRNQQLSDSDRAALGLRLKNLTLTAGGAKFLADRGGHRFTKGWIENGDKSVVSKHFMWLWRNRDKYDPDMHPVTGAVREGAQGRLMVEGGCDELMTVLRTSSAGADVVVAVLILIWNAQKAMTSRNLPQDGVVVSEDDEPRRMWVTAEAVGREWKKQKSEGNTGMYPSSRLIWSLLSGFVRGKMPTGPTTVPGHEKCGSKHWVEVDMRVIEEFCDRNGRELAP